MSNLKKALEMCGTTQADTRAVENFVANRGTPVADALRNLSAKVVEQAKELATEKKCHAIAKSFHDLAIADRNLADHKLSVSEARLRLAESALEAADELGRAMYTHLPLTDSVHTEVYRLLRLFVAARDAQKSGSKLSEQDEHEARQRKIRDQIKIDKWRQEDD